MSTTIKNIDIRIGEDVREPVSPAAGVDVSGWAGHVIKGYFYDGSTVIATITATDSASGQIVRGADGYFVMHWKHAFTNTLTVSKTRYSRQARRVDSSNNTVLVSGVVNVLPYLAIP